jgi:hypothetical protein
VAPVLPQWSAGSALSPAANFGYACPLPI